MNQSTPNPSPPETGQTFGFAYELQRKILAMMLFAPKLMGENLSAVRPEHFDSSVLASMAKLLVDFFQEYGRVPGVEEMEEEIVLFLEKKPKRFDTDGYWTVFGEVLDEVESDFRYIAEKTADFARYQMVEAAILKSASLLHEKHDYQGIVRLITEAAGTRLEGAEYERELDSVCVADVVQKPLEWFWHNTFPKAQLSLLVGKPGSGKSFFTMMMAARVSSGEGFPTHSEYTVDRSQVLVLQMEDSIATTCKKRLRWEGAYENNIHFLLCTKDRQGNTYPVDLSTDLKKVRQKMDELGNVKLLIVDPLSAYVGISAKMDPHKQHDVQLALKPLMTFAEKEGISVIGIMHVNKNQMSGDPIHRIMDSAAWGQMPRVVWFIVKDRQDPELRYFLVGKNNEVSETEKRKAEFVFRIQDNHIVVAPDVQPMGLAEAIGPEPPEDAKERRGKLKTAVAFLEEQKAKGTRELSAKDVNLAFPDINDNTWSQARRKLKIKPVQRPDGWWWPL